MHVITPPLQNDRVHLMNIGLIVTAVQVLGLSNYSTDPAAADLRACIKADRPAAELALDFTLKRLRGMWHVGVYENLRRSLASLATSRGVDVKGTAYRSNTAHAFSYDGGEGEDDKVR